MNSSNDKVLQKILIKVEDGRKLTRKEKKKYDDYLQEQNKTILQTQDDKQNKELDDFSLITEKILDDKSGKDIVLKNFSITVKGKILLENTNLTIAEGLKYGMVGKNGIGKSTILKHIAEGKIPFELDLLYVQQEVEGNDISVIDTVLSADTQRTELLSKYKLLTIKVENDDVSDKIMEEYLSLEEKIHSLGLLTIESKARKILTGLGFTPEMQSQPTSSFSGGWRMRIAIGKALLLEPTLLMLDEPTNHLDFETSLWLANYLSNWKKTLVVISHDIGFLNSVVDYIIHLENHKITTYKGNYDSFKKQLLISKKEADKKWKNVEKELKLMKKQSKTKKEQLKFLQDKALLGITRPPKDYQVTIKFPNALSLSRPVLEVKNVSFQYHADKPIFKNLDAGIDMDSRITIVGRNGAGKSTFLNLLVGSIKPTEGEIFRNHALRIGYFNQHFINQLPPESTPIEYLQSLNTDISLDEARAYLGKIGLSGNHHLSLIHKLSGGQKARVSFCALQIIKPHILLLDEPTNHLDVESIEALIKAINEYNGGVVIISHDFELISKTKSQLWICDNYTLTPYHKEYDDYIDEIISAIEDIN